MVQPSLLLNGLIKPAISPAFRKSKQFDTSKMFERSNISRAQINVGQKNKLQQNAAVAGQSKQNLNNITFAGGDDDTKSELIIPNTNVQLNKYTRTAEKS